MDMGSTKYPFHWRKTGDALPTPKIGKIKLPEASQTQGGGTGNAPLDRHPPPSNQKAKTSHFLRKNKNWEGGQGAMARYQRHGEAQ